MIPNVDLRICFKGVGSQPPTSYVPWDSQKPLRFVARNPGLEDVDSTHSGPEILPNLTTLVASDIQRSKKHKCPKVAGLVKLGGCKYFSFSPLFGEDSNFD